MKTLSRFISALVLICSVASGAALAADPVLAGEKDPLRATLMESKEKSKGLIIHTAGSAIPMVVVSLDERYVIGRSQQATRIVVRIDRIDGISASL
ncbi:MAG: hypothetical protein KBF98_14795 [Rhodoferax sp.]|nr:hypothetical protein [Rhodoferax sp.]